jgi:hypothetical protein
MQKLAVTSPPALKKLKITKDRKKILDPKTGLRLKDDQYSREYTEALRSWMQSTHNEFFEDELIKAGLVAVGLREAIGFEMASLHGGGLILEEELTGDETGFLLAFAAGETLSLEISRLSDISTRDIDEPNVTSNTGENSEAPLSDEAETSELEEAKENQDSLLASFQRRMYWQTQPANELMRRPPDCIKISVLRDAIEKINTDHPVEISNAAFLIMTGHTSKEAFTKKLFSKFMKDEVFLKAQSVVHNIVPEMMSPLARKLYDFMKSLKPTQRETVEVFYGGGNPTLDQAANALGISASSLKERLHWIKKRAIKFFPEFRSLKAKRSASAAAHSSLHDGFYRKSEAQKFNLAVRWNFKTRSLEFIEKSNHTNRSEISPEYIRDIRAWAFSKTPELRFVNITYRPDRKHPYKKGECLGSSDHDKKHFLSERNLMLTVYGFVKGGTSHLRVYHDPDGED